jgi:EAL domain-containing protein (putative c-di-GMP-specific phosphodiesterase class I)
VEFVPVAERSGLIKPMTDLVLRRAVAAASAWTAGGQAVEISVNISMRNLRDPQFVDAVARRIAEHGLAPERLCLEITEGAAMADPEQTLAVLRRLRQVGVRIAIDDFGTGYSSLGYLRRLPVDALKIDRSFVAGLTRDSASRSIVKATIELGHSLELSVIAEGVEDDAQLRALRELGCDRAQGYRISRPLPAEDVAGWLARESSKYSG